MKYKTIYPITGAQIDAAYRLNIDGLLTFFENTVARYFTSLGLAAFDLQKEDKTWVITEINTELPQPPTMWSEDVEITIWVSETSSFRVWIDFIALEVHSGKIVATGNSCWSLFSMTERKALVCEHLIPTEQLETELAAGTHGRRQVMKHSDDFVATLKHRVNRIDLDFNGHMNNRRYVQMALACFDDNYLSDRRPDYLNIRFLRESLIGDEIATRTYPTQDPDFFVGSITNSSEKEICRVLTHWIKKEPVPDISEVNLVRNDA